ncbi:BfmA/BtgA family mobilization protein [Mariniflexile gromovii]|uniref:Uncharacterized protein n=1 Tax=Mariniflexile gromovii TaxID=362523 RepID=A0ABS4BTX8_9FLAO|nr:BfmA/BtgA family mobilization protein [Mariniflexile gromovii]MBP0904034.1 hypothetical protein [Mariniflexile gromovii]
MDDFNTIRLRKKTINNFKEYSKMISPNYSETLDYMIAYFKDNNISPYDLPNKFGLKPLINDLNKRTNAIATILRDIEKNQLEPTRQRLESLFDAMDEIKEPIYIAKSLPEIEASKSDTERMLDYYSNAYESKNRELHLVKTELKNLVKNLSCVKNTFGKDYFRLDMSKEKLEDIKTRLL